MTSGEKEKFPVICIKNRYVHAYVVVPWMIKLVFPFWIKSYIFCYYKPQV